MTKVLIVSDTHGDQEILLAVKKKESPHIVLHAGDFCTNITFISKHVDYFVAGNNDNDGEQMKLFEIEGIKFYLTHGHQYFFFRNKSIAKDAKLFNCDIAITGHTHIESIESIDNILLINPGSLVFPRNLDKQKTYCILNVNNGEILNYEIKKWNH